MNIRILSWNVRGANDKEKRKIIKALIKSQRADLVSLGNKDEGDEGWDSVQPRYG